MSVKKNEKNNKQYRYEITAITDASIFATDIVENKIKIKSYIGNK